MKLLETAHWQIVCTNPKGYVWYSWVFDYGLYGNSKYIRIFGLFIHWYSI